jgi:ribonuclease P protein component
MAPRIARLKRRSEFLRAAAKGRKWASRGLVLQAVPHEGGDGAAGDVQTLHVGYTASRKVGGAVERNRAKRRLRAAVARVMPERAIWGYDYVLIARLETLSRPFGALVGDLEAALGRLGLDRQAQPRGRRAEGNRSAGAPSPRQCHSEARKE